MVELYIYIKEIKNLTLTQGVCKVKIACIWAAYCNLAFGQRSKVLLISVTWTYSNEKGFVPYN